MKHLRTPEMGTHSSLGIRATPAGVMYRFTLRDKIIGLLEGLRMRFFPRKILLAGPYVGEFGHELMDWQACIQACVPRYREVHVITYPGREFLYPVLQGARPCYPARESRIQARQIHSRGA